MLLRSRGTDVLRVKGLLNVSGADGPVVINGVQHHGDRRTRLVLIVRDIARADIERSLAAFNGLGQHDRLA